MWRRLTLPPRVSVGDRTVLHAERILLLMRDLAREEVGCVLAEEVGDLGEALAEVEGGGEDADGAA